MPGSPVILGKETLAEGRFVGLRRILWRDAGGEERAWESAERMHNAGAALIIAELEPSGRLVLIRQFRPPAARHVVEFPAGLVEPGEDPAEAAARELREETGYVARELTVFPAAYSTPGLSDESVFMVQARIDETAEENLRPRTAFDASEMIETILTPKDGLREFYRRECEAGTVFDAKLAAFILAGEISPGGGVSPRIVPDAPAAAAGRRNNAAPTDRRKGGPV